MIRPAVLTTAAAILLLISLSLSEAAGVTNVAATIIRIATGEGTLVIEADDPNVKVAINGEEVTIHGTGVEEVRLRPGSYKLAASKDGQPVNVDRELVKISRGGKQIVRVAVEPSIARAEQGKIPVAAWQPPENPDPTKILREAQADTQARRYETALAKHVWYHQHALEYGPGQTGVRLSFAMSSWAKLCGDYPPALDKLLAMRDEAIASVKEGKKIFESFHDLVAINRTIDQEDVTREVFAFLHTYHPADAKRVFAIAEPSLIRGKAYELCGKYLTPEEALSGILRMRRLNKDLAPKMKDGGKSLLEHDERSFTNKVTTLVALLVVNGRKAEAEQVVADAKKEWNDTKFHAKLADALKGNVPEPWPPSRPEIRAPKRLTAEKAP